MAQLTLRVNGETKTVSVEPDTPLLYVLRNDLELNGPKFGCGLAQCGACTVLLDGKPIRSCVLLVSVAAKGNVTTIEGLGTPDKLHPLQAAFIAELSVMSRRAGDYIDKILKGAHPSDLPIEQPTEYVLIVNLKAAEKLRLKIPESILLRAGEVTR